MRASVPFEGGSTSKADFQGWQLPAHRPALGVHLVGDKAHILIPADATLPAIGEPYPWEFQDWNADMSSSKYVNLFEMVSSLHNCCKICEGKAFMYS